MTFFIRSLMVWFVSFSCSVFLHAKEPKNKRAVIVYDDQSGKILHEEFAHELRHPASLTKKMALYVVFQALKSRKIHFYTEFPISKRAASQEPCSAGYRAGTKQKVIDLIKAGVTQSANDGLVALAEGLAGSVENFVKQMNATARELGMSKTIFYNSTGLPHPYQFTTAYDMLILAKALVRDFPEYYQFFKTVNFSHNGRNFRNHNRMLGVVEGMDGIKTGFVNASGFCVSTSTCRGGRRIYVVFMGGKSWRGRDKEVVGLIETAFRTSPQIPSLAPVHPAQPKVDPTPSVHLVEVSSQPHLNHVQKKDGEPFVQYLSSIDAQSELQKNLEAIRANRAKTKQKEKVISLATVKPIDKPSKVVKAVFQKPLSKKVKKTNKRKRA